MEDFEEILMEANESVSPTSFHGRLVMAVLAKLVTDLFPNFSYRSVSSAFVRSPLQTVESNAKEVMPRGLAENLLFGSKYVNDREGDTKCVNLSWPVVCFVHCSRHTANLLDSYSKSNV